MLMVHDWFSESFLSNDARGIQFGDIKQGVSSAPGLLVYNWNEQLTLQTCTAHDVHPLLPLLMRWPNQKAAVQKQAKSSFRASSCSTILIVRDFLGTTFTSTSHLTLRLFNLFMLDKGGSNFQPAWEIFWIWVRWSKHLQQGRVTRPTDRTFVNDGPACHCACLEQPSHSHFIHAFRPRCS